MTETLQLLRDKRCPSNQEKRNQNNKLQDSEPQTTLPFIFDNFSNLRALVPCIVEEGAQNLVC